MVEVFWHDESSEPGCWYSPGIWNDENDPAPSGWYWWTCEPGCLPDGDPTGPFDTARVAHYDATGEYE